MTMIVAFLLAAGLAGDPAKPPPRVSRDQAVAIAERHVRDTENGRDVSHTQIDVFSKGKVWRVVFALPMPRIGGASVVKVDKTSGRVTGYHHDQ